MNEDLIKRLDALDNCANWQGANRHIGPIAREAKRAIEAAKCEIERYRGTLSYLQRQAETGLMHPQIVIQNCRASLDPAHAVKRAALSGERQSQEEPK